MSRATLARMEELHGLVAEVLVEQLKADREGRLLALIDGEWVHVKLSAASYSQAIKFMSDNGVTTPAPNGATEDTLKADMPNFDDDTIVPFRRDE